MAERGVHEGGRKLKSIVGITTSFSSSEQRLDHRYVRAVEAAGGLAVIVPVTENRGLVGQLTEMIHGLIVPGGPAVTDGMTGNLPDELETANALRVASDKAVLRECMRADMPILGICYGMQLLNAVAGGTIWADVERQLPGAAVHSEKRGGTTHPVRPAAGSHFARILGMSEQEVNTRHLQAVNEPGAGFRVAATSPDGVIEAIENDSGSQIGVQFHPERMGAEMLPLFVNVVRLANRYAYRASLRV